MIQKSTLGFLKKLKQNNNRDWFEKNKEVFLKAKADMEKMVQCIIDEIGKSDKRIKGQDAKKCMFRIYRDVRFSKDKRPYKINLSAIIGPGGKKIHDVPGLYIHIQPGASFVAGGLWQPEPPHLAAIRQEIDYSAKEFMKITGNKDFKKYFGKLSAEDKLKTVPKGYDKTHPQIEFLKLKSFIVERSFTDAQVTSASFAKEVAKTAKAMELLNQFLAAATD
jgi:uncharacterized protein (TIGR02453 family)